MRILATIITTIILWVISKHLSRSNRVITY